MSRRVLVTGAGSDLAASVRSPDPALAEPTTRLVTNSALSADEVAKRHAPALVHSWTVAAAERLHRRIETA